MYYIVLMIGVEIMPLSEDRKASINRSDAKYLQILLKPYKDEAINIKSAAASVGQSMQAYILQAVRERMERDRERFENPSDYPPVPFELKDFKTDWPFTEEK